ncbi:MAG: alkaline phosphatase family protein [Candidatus Heimdallarchaeota archaeon]|nr:alkaline phosphatase family protein [Candidatus Heimdallarchaeota archaeon]
MPDHSLSLKSLGSRKDLFLPDLEQNISKVLPTALTLFGYSPPQEETLEPSLKERSFWRNIQEKEVSNIVFLIIDALGLEQFLSYSSLFQRIFKANGLALSSVFPTITSTCIPSLRLGKMPVAHGILGHKIYFSEVGNIVDTLTLEAKDSTASLAQAGVSVTNWLWCDFPIAKNSCIEQIDLIENHIANSGLSNFLTNNAYTIGYYSLVDCFASLKRVLETPSDKQRLINIYLGSIDAISHRYTTKSFEYQTLLEYIEEIFLKTLQTLDKSILDKTVVFLTSDHGQEDLLEEKAITITNDAEARLNTLINYRGRSGRVVHLYPKAGKLEDVLIWCEEELGELALVLTPEKYPLLLGEGATANKVIERMGEVQILLGKNASLYFGHSGKFDPVYNLGLNATHGSLSKGELLVPLLIARLSDFFNL